MSETASRTSADAAPFTLLLGVAQDGGYPQAGCTESCCAPAWKDPTRSARAVSLGVVDPESGECWLIDASPDFPSQLHDLNLSMASPGAALPPTAVFLTHAHIGHYTGLMYLGREAMGAQDVPVYGMPRMLGFLREHGPWEQLCRLGNIELRELHNEGSVSLNSRISVRPFVVPHRGEYSETVGVVVEGPRHKVLYLPDIDHWGRSPLAIESLLEEVDCAYIDGTFFDVDELPSRDRGEIPHPLVAESIDRFAPLSAELRSRICFVHFNHSNPLLQPESEARKRVEQACMRWARDGMRVEL